MSKRAVPRFTPSGSTSIHCGPRLPQLRQLLAEISFPLSVFLHHRRWGARDERRVAQLRLHCAQLAFQSRDLLIEPIAFRRFVTGCDDQKQFAKRGNRDWNADLRLELRIEFEFV